MAAIDIIADMRYYRVAMITFCCLAIEQTADSSWLSGKGMGYCMLIALCLNANRNQMMEMKRQQMLVQKKKQLLGTKSPNVINKEKIEV